MKITFVMTTACMAGGVRVIAIYAEKLRRRGHEVTVVSLPEQRPLRERVRSVIRGGRWADERRPRSFIDEVDVPHHVLESFRPVEDRDVPDADVVVATWWETAEWVARLSPSKGAKAHLVQHYEIWGGEPERVKATWRLPVHRIVISKWLKELAENEYGDGNVSHVPNSVDMEQFNAPEREKNAIPTVGLLYSDIPFKGVDISLKAMEIVRRDVPEMKLVTFGLEGPMPSLPVPPVTEFVKRPAQEQIRELYAKCDVWLCGSRAEGFHLPPLEAMACRCPVVSTRVGGPMDIVEDGVNGYVVDVEDAEALADRLKRVLTLPAGEWKRMSDAAYRTAESYTWDDAVVKLEEAFENAIAASRQVVGV